MVNCTRRCALVLLLLGLALTFSFGMAVAGTMEIVSVTNDGKVRWGQVRPSPWGLGLSDDGRYAVFATPYQLAPDDMDPLYYSWDVYLRDRQAATTTLLTQGGGGSSCGISGNGKYVAFRGLRLAEFGLFLLDVATKETKLISSHTGYTFAVDYDGDVFYVDGYTYDIYKYDRRLNQNSLVYSPGGSRISTRFSVNNAGNLLCFLENSRVVLYDLDTGNKTLVSRAIDGTPSTGYAPKMSKSGKYVIFNSYADNLTAEPYPTELWNLFIYDIDKDTIEKVDFIHPQLGYLYPSHYGYNMGFADVSDDGRFIAAGLEPPPSVTSYQFWGSVLDRQTGAIEFAGADRNLLGLNNGSIVSQGTDTLDLASIYSSGGIYATPYTPAIWLYPTISPDGRYVLSTGSNYSLYDRFGGKSQYVADAGSDQIVEQESPNGAYVTLQGRLAEGSCGDSTFEWSWDGGGATGENPTVQLPAGTSVVTLAWSGCGATAEDTVAVTVTDTTPPTATVDFIGASGRNNWYVGSVTASIGAEDAGSGVQNIRYSLNGGTEVVDPGISAQAILDRQGLNTLSFHAVDAAGNASTLEERTLLIDSVAPTASAQLSGKVNKDGIYVTEVAVQLQGADATSGVQAIYYNLDDAGWRQIGGATVSLTVTEDNAHTVVFHAVDVAGNAQALQSVSFTIDQSLLGQTITEEIKDLVPSIPPDAFFGNNPNYADKLTSEINKVLAQLYAIDDTLSPAEKIREYEWAKQKLETKILDEFRRMLVDEPILTQVETMIGDAVAALDKVIFKLQADL